jgi:hypothetical protein
MVDLYVRPPSSDGPWHNDYHQMDVIVSFPSFLIISSPISREFCESNGGLHLACRGWDPKVRAAYRYTMMAVAEWRSRQEADASTTETHSEKQGGDLWTRKQATKLVRRPPANNH